MSACPVACVLEEILIPLCVASTASLAVDASDNNLDGDKRYLSVNESLTDMEVVPAASTHRMCNLLMSLLSVFVPAFIVKTYVP